MRNLYLLKSRFALVAAVMCSPIFVSTSCVNSDYDLDKEIDMELNLGGEITLPVGSTKQIRLGDILDPEQIENLEAIDGNYKIGIGDEMSIEIEKLGGKDGFGIKEIHESINKTIDLATADIEPLEINMDDIVIPIESTLKEVNNDVRADVGDDFYLDTGLADLKLSYDVYGHTITAGITDIPAGVSLPAGSAVTIAEHDRECKTAIMLGENIACPDAVKAITKLDFAGSQASITLDVSAFAAVFSNLEVTLPSFQITFPEGFVLYSALDTNSADNIITIKNIKVNSKKTFTFNIVEYNKRLNNVNGYLEFIEGDIEYLVSDKVQVAGVTKGATSISSDVIKIDVVADAAVADMAIDVATVDIAIDGRDELCGPITFDVGDMVKSITSVTMDPAKNTIDVDVTPIAISSGLNIDGDDIEIRFPADTYDIKVGGAVSKSGSNFILSIPLRSVVGGAGFHESVAVNKILFVQGEAKDEMITFDPAVTMSGTNMSISMGMPVGAGVYSTTLSTYNRIVREMSGESKIVASVGTPVGGIAVASADAEINAYYAAFEVDPITFDEQEKIDEQLVSLDRMNFTEDVYASVDIMADIDLSYAGAPELSFKDFAITFPNFLKFAPNDQVDITDTGDGHSKVTLKSGKDHFSTANGVCEYSLKLKIEEIDFAQYPKSILEGGVFTLEDQVTIDGGLQISGGKIDSSNFGDKIVCNIDYSISEMSIGEVYGEVNPEIPVDEDGSRIDIGEITGELEDLDISLTLANPTITLTAINPLQIPLELSSLSLQPSKGGSTEGFEPIAIDKVITVASAHGDTPSTTKILISGKEYEGTPESGTQYVTMKNLNSIINGAPDCIDILYEAGVPPIEEGEDLHMIDLNKDYEFKLEYAVDIPLAFEEFDIAYNTTVKDLGKELEEFIMFIPAFEVDLTSINTLPIELSITKITPQDADGNELDLKSITKEGSNKIAANGTSTLTLSLEDNEAGDLKRLDCLDISVAATISETEGGKALNVDQTIQFKIVARVPDGVHVDLNDLNDLTEE